MFPLQNLFLNLYYFLIVIILTQRQISSLVLVLDSLMGCGLGNICAKTDSPEIIQHLKKNSKRKSQLTPCKLNHSCQVS
jgi:hypothetical protein